MKKFEQYLEMAQAQNNYQKILNARKSNKNVYKNIDRMGGIIAFNPAEYKNINIETLIDLWGKSKPVKAKGFPLENEKGNLPKDKENWDGFGWSSEESPKINFQKIPDIKNFIETNSYNLKINKPLGIRMTTGGGIRWGLENKIYGNPDDIDKLMIDLKKGIEIQLKGPGNSTTEAFECGDFIFYKDPEINSIYFIGTGRLKNNPEIWKQIQN